MGQGIKNPKKLKPSDRRKKKKGENLIHWCKKQQELKAAKCANNFEKCGKNFF